MEWNGEYFHTKSLISCVEMYENIKIITAHREMLLKKTEIKCNYK